MNDDYHYTGKIELDFCSRHGRTIAQKSYHQGVSKLMKPLYLTPEFDQVTYYLVNLGGGAVAGDRYHQFFNLQADTKVYLTTQSALKVFQSINQLPVKQDTVIELKANSILEYINEPVILYQNARYQQQTKIVIDPTANLFLCDILSPGWDSEAKNFTYEELDTSCEIYCGDELIVFDRLRLKPKEISYAQLGRLENFKYVVSGWIIGPEINLNELIQLNQELGERSDILFGLSELQISGFAFRILGNQTQILFEQIYRLRAIFRKINHLSKIGNHRKY